MLGKFLNKEAGLDVPNDGNHQLYLRHAVMETVKDKNVNLLINEDETTYVK